MRLFLFALALFSSFSYSAGTVTSYVATYGGVSTSPQSSAATACAKLKGMGGLFPNYTPGGATGTGTGGSCYWLTSTQSVVYYGTWQATTAPCADPNVVTNNVCGPAPNLCTAKKDQPVGYKVSGDPVSGQTYVVDGCAVSSGGVWICQTSGETGQKTCSTRGTYTGEQGPTTPNLGSCGAEECPKEPPTTTGQNQNCTAPA
ncbi:hypothetical protein, partial [Glutamicibacter soli]|uniref:hypothetical protein n=1 Tax=Glutamicibacter soli TaxID=453836 RepID=UPI001F2E49FC